MKTQIIILTLAFLMSACGHMTTDEERNPAAVSVSTKPLNIKVKSYKQELRTVEGKIVPLHFLQAEEGWYLALGCAPNGKSEHEFEVYDKAYAKPENLDQNVMVSLLKGSNSFATNSECQKAFQRIQTASNKNPVCLQDTKEGVLVSECRDPNKFDRTQRSYGSRF